CSGSGSWICLEAWLGGFARGVRSGAFFYRQDRAARGREGSGRCAGGYEAANALGGFDAALERLDQRKANETGTGVAAILLAGEKRAGQAEHIVLAQQFATEAGVVTARHMS